MPRLDADTETHNAGGNFTFTGARISGLGATEYTLVNIEVDMSGSVSSFVGDLKLSIETAIDACAKSPRAENLLVRVSAFSTAYRGGLNEVHGFLPLASIDKAVYDTLKPGGGTPLFDATYSGVKAINAYGKKLFDQDYLANAITFIITDGDDTGGAATPAMIKDEIARSAKDEVLESHVTVLIGINTAHCRPYLDRFQKEAGLTQFIDVGDATKGKLAKLAAFVSQSISSQSQALGTGGASQAIAATI